jgi:hypothetical protein
MGALRLLHPIKDVIAGRQNGFVVEEARGFCKAGHFAETTHAVGFRVRRSCEKIFLFLLIFLPAQRRRKGCKGLKEWAVAPGYALATSDALAFESLESLRPLGIKRKRKRKRKSFPDLL